MSLRRIVIASALLSLACSAEPAVGHDDVGAATSTAETGQPDESGVTEDSGETGATTEAGETGETGGPGETGETGEPVEDPVLEADDFACIQDMTKVRRFYITNVLGDLDATLAVANSASGGDYPVGTLIQLVPTEAMVKRAPGFAPQANDWEFFSLAVDANGTEILERGADEVVNAFGGNCFGCHAKAEPAWDFVCETDHGCDPLPISAAQIEAIQAADPRCP